MLSLASLESSKAEKRLCAPHRDSKNSSSPSSDPQQPGKQGGAQRLQRAGQGCRTRWQIPPVWNAAWGEWRMNGNGLRVTQIPLLAAIPAANPPNTDQELLQPSGVPISHIGTDDLKKKKKEKFNKKNIPTPKKTPNPTPSPLQDILQVLKLTGPIISSTCG